MKIVGALSADHEKKLSQFAESFGISTIEVAEDGSEIVVTKGSQKWCIYAANVQNFETVHVERVKP